MHPRSRTVRVATAVLGVIAASTCLTVTGQAHPAAVRTERPAPRIRVAYLAWEPGSEEEHRQRASLAQVLTFVHDRLAQEGVDARFELTQGTYYQIWAWMRTGEVDAAVVSPFIAYLLQRDGHGVPFVELLEPPAADALSLDRGSEPRVRAVQKAKELPNPKAQFDAFLQQLLDGPNDPGLEQPGHATPTTPSPYHVSMVAHLSTSGFVAPLVYAHRWLERQRRPDRQVQEFWQRFFSSIRLEMLHACEPPPDSAAIWLCFSDSRSGKYRNAPAYLDTVKTSAPEQQTDDKDRFLIPRDLIVVRPEVLMEVSHLAKPGQLVATTALGEWLVRDDVGRRHLLPSSQQPYYVAVREVDSGAHDRFAQAIAPVFKRGVPRNRTLQAAISRWFDLAQFDFTIEEIVSLLRMDQETSNQKDLSLVLPGGGVKSLYQAVLLKQLYGATKKNIRNVGQDIGEEAPLKVQNIIGTSGGALIGLFAVLAKTPHFEFDSEVKQVADQSIFSSLDTLRALSVLVLLAIFAVILRICSPAIPKETRLPRSTRRIPLVIVGAVIAICAATLARTDVGEIHGAVGALLIATLIALHFVYSCSVSSKDWHGTLWSLVPVTNRVLWWTGAVAVSFLVLGFYGAALGALDSTAVNVLNSAGLSEALAVTGAFGLTATMVLALQTGRFSLGLTAVRDYAVAMTTLAVYVAVSYLLLWVLCQFEFATLLEITTNFWLSLVPLGAIVSIAIITVVVRGRRRYERQPGRHGRISSVLVSVNRGFGLLLAHRSHALSPAPSAALLMAAAITMGWWIVAAPGIYENAEAHRSFEAGVSRLVDRGHASLSANLIVTGTLVSSMSCSGAPEPRVFPKGDVYFCFPGTGSSCARPAGQRWIAFDPRQMDLRTLVDAAFASGSPFPIFSPMRVHLPNGCALDLIDGGYAHNVPLEAAHLGGSRQVLIVNSTPDAAEQPIPSMQSQLVPRYTFGRLIRDSGKIFPLLFERAQQVDRDIASHMMVASLTPSDVHGAYPFLVDFRQTIQRELLDRARCDLEHNRRIGRVQRWGPPSVVSMVDTASGRAETQIAVPSS